MILLPILPVLNLDETLSSAVPKNLILPQIKVLTSIVKHAF